jgi:hypothetical protein
MKRKRWWGQKYKSLFSGRWKWFRRGEVWGVDAFSVRGIGLWRTLERASASMRQNTRLFGNQDRRRVLRWTGKGKAALA